MDFLLRFVHISDTHITPDINYSTPYASYPPLLGMQKLIQEVNALPFTPDFILHTGDVAYDPVPEVYPTVRDLMAQFKAPVYYVAGNHDSSAALQQVVMQHDPLLPHLHGDYAIRGVQLICVDSNGPAQVPAGNIPPQQLTWLEKLCAADDTRPLLIAVHHNIVPCGVPWLDDFMRTNNGEAFHEIVVKAKHRLRGVFHGHIHQPIDIVRDGVLYSAAASPWCQFGAFPMPDNIAVTADPIAQPGFSVVTITPEQTYIRRHTFTIDGR